MYARPRLHLAMFPLVIDTTPLATRDCETCNVGVRTIMCASKVMDVAALGRGLLGSGHYDKTVRTYDMRTGALVESAQPHEASLTSITLSPGTPPCYTPSTSQALQC